MAKVAFVIAFILSSTVYFLTIENNFIHNHLVCQFTAHQIDNVAENHLQKIRNSLPENFPSTRYEYLVQKQLSQGKTRAPATCDQAMKKDYEDTVLYHVRPYLYPMFPGIFRTMDRISESLKYENMKLQNISAFKKIIESERETFRRFIVDCSLIKEMSDQIKLLEKHLKIDKNVRGPTQIADKQNVEVRMSKSIRKQINFAKKHLSSNEKLFVLKWKIYFDFEPETKLCPR